VKGKFQQNFSSGDADFDAIVRYRSQNFGEEKDESLDKFYLKDKMPAGVSWRFPSNMTRIDPQTWPNPCVDQWHGILCSCNTLSCHHVTTLSFRFDNLMGTLPSSLGNFTEVILKLL